MSTTTLISNTNPISKIGISSDTNMLEKDAIIDAFSLDSRKQKAAELVRRQTHQLDRHGISPRNLNPAPGPLQAAHLKATSNTVEPSPSNASQFPTTSEISSVVPDPNLSTTVDQLLQQFYKQQQYNYAPNSRNKPPSPSHVDVGSNFNQKYQQANPVHSSLQSMQAGNGTTNPDHATNPPPSSMNQKDYHMMVTTQQRNQTQKSVQHDANPHKYPFQKQETHFYPPQTQETHLSASPSHSLPENKASYHSSKSPHHTNMSIAIGPNTTHQSCAHPTNPSRANPAPSSQYYNPKSDSFSPPTGNSVHSLTSNGNQHSSIDHHLLQDHTSSLAHGEHATTLNESHQENPDLMYHEHRSSEENHRYKRKRDEVASFDSNQFENQTHDQTKIASKLELALNQIDSMEMVKNNQNTELFTLFSDLQGISADFGIEFNTPEVVVVGMQSDGKSSFIEALLGFQFNIVDTNIGTRRPLIIQMINDGNFQSPCCRFRREDSALLDGSEDTFEEFETPVSELSHKIIHLTNMKAGSSKERVSSVPIILRVNYKYCANLTIFDTPGFRLGGSSTLRSEIEEMVLRIAFPKHRIIVCLDQSTVEWVNTVSRPLIARIDPEFKRTIIVNTKFDNRIKELREPISTNKYLEGEGLTASKKPFFISIPVHRNLDPVKFKGEMRDCYLNDLKCLLAAGFDQEKFGSQIGIFHLKSHLEKLVHVHYMSSLAPTLHQLNNLIDETQAELKTIEKELEDANTDRHKRRVWFFIQKFSTLIDNLLQGSVVGNPEFFGQTLQQEKISSSILAWPTSKVHWANLDVLESSSTTSSSTVASNMTNMVMEPLDESIPHLEKNKTSNPFSNTTTNSNDPNVAPNSSLSTSDISENHNFDSNSHPSNLTNQSKRPQDVIIEEKVEFEIPNANLALYGGSQLNRLMSEFEYVAHSLEMPPASLDEVASALGMSKNHNMPNITDAASDIARSKSKTTLFPIVQVVLRRANFIFSRMFDISFSVVTSQSHDNGLDQGLSVLNEYPEFVREMRQVYESFISSMIQQCERAMRSDINKLTTIVDWDLISGVQELTKDYNYLNPTSLETRERVCRILAPMKSCLNVPTLPSNFVPFGNNATSGRTGNLYDENRSYPNSCMTREINNDRYKQTLQMAGKLFAGIRFFFVKHARANLNTFLVEPMFSQILPTLMDHFSNISRSQFENLFNLGTDSLRERQTMLLHQLERIRNSRHRFEYLLNRVKGASSY